VKPEPEKRRVHCGGDWWWGKKELRVVSRGAGTQLRRDSQIGFRLVLDAPKEKR